MSAMRRPAILIAALAVLGSALTACGSQPREANSAVIIGNRVVSVDDVQAKLETALNKEPAARELAKSHKLDLVSRSIVTQLVRHELITEVAKRENLTVSEKDVEEALAANAPAEDPVQRSVQAAFDPREYARDQLLTQRLGQKYRTKLEITFDGATVRSVADAKTRSIDLAKKIAAEPAKVNDILRAASADAPEGSINLAPDQTLSPVSTYQIAAENNGQVLLTPVFAADADTVVAFPYASSEQAGSSLWLVALITKRDTNAALPEDQASVAAEVSPLWDGLVGTHVMGPAVTDLGVKVSPRYGVWDELNVSVAPSEDEKIGVLLPAGGQQQQ
ncbi:hypothetical protein [Actinophytocola sp.]|uniref:hypothetical protein n=1 Tax=Actinophytocola sp. TaxID=1872138 RepID=UPI002D80875E|nr:hypothetical protein [Actinophytocola sp.]HET9141061.1 hypothetical protein [Actinophytocola sp.]